MPPVWISFLESKGSGKVGRTDDAGQSSVLTSVRQVRDSRPEPSVEDSVGQAISFTEVGLEKSIEEDGRVRPRSVNLLGDSRVIDSKERKPGDFREEDGRCRPKDQGRFKGRVYGLLRPRALIKCRGSEEDQRKEQLTVGADPSGSVQGIPRGGRFSRPVGPGSGFQGRGGWGQQSHDRHIGFPWVPRDGHHAYPVCPVNGFHDDRQVGFPQGAPQTGTMPILRVQVAGFREWTDGSSKGCHCNGHTLMKGRGELVSELCIMGGGYSQDHTIQVDLVVARAVLCQAECRPWYREEGVRRRFLGRSVGSRRVAGRGFAATGPAGAPG